MWLTFDQRRGLERLWLSVVENLSKTCSWPTLDPVVGYSKKKKNPLVNGTRQSNLRCSRVSCIPTVLK